jgi:hypothetical protein
MLWSIATMYVFGRFVLPRLARFPWFREHVAARVEALPFWPRFKAWSAGKGICRAAVIA